MGSRTVRWLRMCRTVRSRRRPMRVMVHRSPFLTQSVAVSRSRRSLARVTDHISDAGLVAVGQPHRRMRHILVEAVVSGLTVEFGDKLAGGGEHDGVESG